MKRDDYNYAEMLQELRDSVKLKQLTMSSPIQILRDRQAKINGLNPIVEWYYAPEGMSRLAAEILDDIDEIASAPIRLKDAEADALTNDVLDIVQYVEDLPYLETATLAQVIWEMEKTLRS